MTGKDSKKILRLDKRYMNVNLTLSIIIYSIVVPFCIYLSVDNYIHGKIIVARYALFCAVMTAVGVICFAICKFGKKKRDWLMHLAIQIECLVYWITFVFFLYTGGTEGSSIFLFFVAVPVVFFFFNLVYGLYFCAVFFILMVIYINTPFRYMGFQFPEVYYDRLPMMYLACVIMCAVAQYEVVKAKIKQEDQAGRGTEMMEIVGHEQYAYQRYFNYLPDYFQRLEAGIRTADELGYRPVFFNDGIFGNTAWEDR